MKRISAWLTFISLITFVACGPSKDEQQADFFLKKAQQLIDENNFEQAQQQLDSVHLLFPKMIDKRKLAATLEDTLTRRQSTRSLEYCEKMLPIKICQQDSLLKKFRYEKNEKYQTYGNFISKFQITEQNFNRNYLKCYVDENTDLYIISQFTGQKLIHKMVKVSVGDLSVSTDTINSDSGEFYSFNNDGLYYESLTFMNEKAKDMVAFINQNSNQRIKVELKGLKTFSYNLSDNDKKAISETYQLWQTMKEVKEMTIEINKANRKLFFINKRKVSTENNQNLK